MVFLVFHLDSCPLTDVAAGAAADLDCTVLGFAAVSGAIRRVAAVAIPVVVAAAAVVAEKKGLEGRVWVFVLSRFSSLPLP